MPAATATRYSDLIAHQQRNDHSQHYEKVTSEFAAGNFNSALYHALQYVRKASASSEEHCSNVKALIDLFSKNLSRFGDYKTSDYYSDLFEKAQEWAKDQPELEKKITATFLRFVKAHTRGAENAVRFTSNILVRIGYNHAFHAPLEAMYTENLEKLWGQNPKTAAEHARGDAHLADEHLGCVPAAQRILLDFADRFAERGDAMEAMRCARTFVTLGDVFKLNDEAWEKGFKQLESSLDSIAHKDQDGPKTASEKVKEILQRNYDFRGKEALYKKLVSYAGQAAEQDTADSLDLAISNMKTVIKYEAIDRYHAERLGKPYRAKHLTKHHQAQLLVCLDRLGEKDLGEAVSTTASLITGWDSSAVPRALNRSLNSRFTKFVKHYARVASTEDYMKKTNWAHSDGGLRNVVEMAFNDAQGAKARQTVTRRAKPAAPARNR